MENYLKEVGARVKEARMRKRLSQAQLADLLGLTPPYISNIETGKQNMSITALAKISDVLEVSADWLLRNNTADALAITADELRELLADCTPAERMASCGWRVRRRKRFVTATESNQVTRLLRYRILSYR